MKSFFEALSRVDVYAEVRARRHKAYAHAITGFETSEADRLANAYEMLGAVIRADWVLDCGAGLGENTLAFAAADNKDGRASAVVALDTWLGNAADWASGHAFPPYYHNNMGIYQGFRRFLENVNFHKLCDRVFPLPGGLSTLSDLACFHGEQPTVICLTDLSRFDGSRDWQLEVLCELLADDGVLFGDAIWFRGASLPPMVHSFVSGGVVYLCKSGDIFKHLKKTLVTQGTQEATQPQTLNLTVWRMQEGHIPTHELDSFDTNALATGAPCFVRSAPQTAASGGQLLDSINLRGNERLTKRVSGGIHESAEPRVMVARNMTLVCDGPCNEVPKVYALAANGTFVNDSENVVLQGLASQLLRRGSERGTFDMCYAGTVTECDMPVLYLGGVANFYHWHADHLSALYYLEETAKALGIERFRLAVSNVNAIARESLELLGYVRGEVIDITHAALKAPLVLSLIRNAAPTLNARSSRIFDRAVVRFGDTEKEAPLNTPEYIYLTRSDSNRRRVTNEDELFKALEPLGFKLVRGAELSYLEKVRMFSKARCVVSPHGAGIANTLFSPPGCGVLEMFNPGPANNLNGRLLMSKGHYYKYIIFDTPHQGPQDFAVDVDLVVRETTSLLKAVNGG
ncbi:glycosyltransferase family 61 protein [Kordiimonas aestuarii]|uniref:glycosyltransferase family 61 protein n=1 Tax=Kordiimonas aestuarii TaxID=1005925 RepID=UPI0021CE6A63|nr:glycosyltransferase family 61 protein [Kordiimonas aestuarii]